MSRLVATMPTFCRHNRLLQNCTICAREQHFEARPVVSSSAPKSTQPREAAERADRPRADRTRAPRTVKGGATSVRVRRLARGVEDGYRSPLVPGLKSSEDAQRLADEIAFSATRLRLMEQVAAGDAFVGAPSSWREIAAPGDLEERTQAAFALVVNGPRGLESSTRIEEASAGL